MNFLQVMKNQSAKTTVIINILAVVFLFCVTILAQDSAPIELNLNTPIETEFNQKPAKEIDDQIKELNASETSVFFSVRLLSNQTARVEIEHNGMDITVYARNPAGEKYIYIESPAGNIGKKVLLATSETDGVYIVEIRPAHPIPKPIKLKVQLKEIRQTNENDRFVNDAYSRMVKLSRFQKDANALTIAEFREAIGNYLEIIRLAKIVGDKYWEGESLIFIGHSYFAIGEYQTALEMWFRARDVYQLVNLKNKEGVAVNNIGAALKSIGDYERALSFFQEADNLQKETSNRFDKAATFTNIGSTYFLLGQTQKATENIEQALELYTAMKITGGQATSAGSLGKIYVASGNYEKGIKYLEKSLKFAEISNNRHQTINSKLILGKAFQESGRENEAFEMFLEADLLANEIGIRQFIIASSYNLAKIERDRRNFERAIKYLEKSLAIVEKTRNELKNKDQRATYFATVQDIFELYTELLIERAEKDKIPADISLAFEMSERSRSRSLVELLQEARVDFKKNVDKKLLEYGSDLTRAINSKYQIREGLIARKSEQEKIDAINSEINELEIELANLNLKISKESPRYADLVNAKRLKTKEIQQLLDDETVLLEYKLGKDRSFLWLVTNNSIEVFELPKRQIIEDKARRFYDSTVANKPNENAKHLQTTTDLSEILLSPVAEKLANKRLAIVADGVLQYIPFSALISLKSVKDEVQFLADTNEVIILPSATVLAQLRENPIRKTQNNKTIAIFADPVFDLQDSRIAKNSDKRTKDENIALTQVLRDFRFGETLPRLLASRQESRNISNLVAKNASTIRTDFEANLENIENANLKDHRILHFATHGLLNSSRPELSGLVFSLYDRNGENQHGFLSLNDIYNLDLSSDLIVLSACQTALGKDVRGEGLIGISRGFLYAGSNRIIASLWKVDDSATAEFMKRFYTNHLQKGMSASKALQQTKIEMRKIKRYNSPYYWSAFTLFGDW